MPRYKLTIEYDGTGLAGWQRQVDRESAQSLLEAAVEKLAGAPSVVTGAGRTDAGVHATGQVAHVDIGKELNPYNVMHGINYHLEPLSKQVVVVKAEIAPDDFHARFWAAGRAYCYRIINRSARLALHENRAWHIPEKLNVKAMHEGAQLLLGHQYMPIQDNHENAGPIGCDCRRRRDSHLCGSAFFSSSSGAQYGRWPTAHWQWQMATAAIKNIVRRKRP
jgi:tRNA pseudouridine(38-40) synthase